MINTLAKEEVMELTVEDIKKLIPHRYPMLLIDRMCDLVPGESATGIKCVTANEPFFQGHFPEKPVMPGVLIVEALAQTAGALVIYSMENVTENQIVYFMSIEEAKFRRPVVPGDRLELKVTKTQNRSNVWKFSGEAYVDGNLHAEAKFTAMITK
jgi:3-hydroxyacyl-[acyl-carrier-protein] dehydratase